MTKVLWRHLLRTSSELLCTFSVMFAPGSCLFGQSDRDESVPTQSMPCNKSVPATHVADGVNHYDCTQRDTKVHVVTIDRNRPNSEIWLLDTRAPQPPVPPTKLFLQTVADHAQNYNAVVAVNGYNWGPRWADGCVLSHFGTPTTTTYETGLALTYNGDRCDACDRCDEAPMPDQEACRTVCDEHHCPEVHMGFHTKDDRIEALRIPLRETFNPQKSYEKNQMYYDNLYGSNSTFMADGYWTGYSIDENMSIVGYSKDQIVFMTTAVAAEGSTLANVLTSFGVTDAVAQDGGASAQMVVRGADPIVPTPGFGCEVRPVAYAIGLVDLFPVNVSNPGFERPALGEGEKMRHIGRDPSACIGGWHGSVDLLHGHQPAHGNQIVSLSDIGSCGEPAENGDGGYLETSLPLPAATYCLLRFSHGVYGPAEATFDVMINGTTVRKFLGTEDPGGLKEETIRFQTGAAPTTLVRFQSTTGTACFGATIDDVSVSCTHMPDATPGAIPGIRALPQYLGSDIAASPGLHVGWGSYQVDSNWYGCGFSIGDVRYDKGIFAHADSAVSFPLGGAYSTLNLCVGLDDVDALGGDGATVTVEADGRTLWTTDIRNDPEVGRGPATCMPAQSMAGVQTLTLKANPRTGIYCDTVEWVNARVQ